MLHVVEDHTTDELKQLIRAEQNGKLIRRLTAVLLAKQGNSVEHISACVCLEQRQVYRWLERYNTGGIAALSDKPGRGTPEPLTPHQIDQLSQRLDAGPRPEDKCCAFRGRDVKRILREEFGVVRVLSSVYALLHRIGYAAIKPRPVHPEHDPAKIEEFEKKRYQKR